MKLLLDAIAVWRATPVAELTRRPLPKGLRYLDGEEVKALPKTAYRYAKNYGKISLIIFTLEEDEKKVEKLLDKASKKKLPSPSEELTYLENK